ncbi:MAG: CBS domain-containing protein [Halobacteria archaeon]|nr:CBS domain-containing protein [Halobacteria archaeon]
MKDAVRENFDLSVSSYEEYERQTSRFSDLARLLCSEMVDAKRRTGRTEYGGIDCILDVGAGTGVSTSVFEEEAQTVAVALDISRGMLRQNTSSYRIQADMSRLPFTDDSFGGVGFTASLFLVRDPDTAVEEASRVLHEGGVVGAVAPVGWVDADGDRVFSSSEVEPISPADEDDVYEALDERGNRRDRRKRRHTPTRTTFTRHSTRGSVSRREVGISRLLPRRYVSSTRYPRSRHVSVRGFHPKTVFRRQRIYSTLSNSKPLRSSGSRRDGDGSSGSESATDTTHRYIFTYTVREAMLIEEIMSRDVVKAEVDETVQEGVGKMLENRVGSVVVTQSGDPTGIMTESDVLRHTYETRKPFTDVVLSEVMSSPLVTVEPDVSVRAASEKMKSNSVKKLVVMDSLELEGVVTLMDIVYSQNEILKEAHSQEDREGWDSPDEYLGYESFE